MPNVTEHRKFVCTDAKNNNNKFWEFLYHDDNTVIVKYGRVGSTCNVEPAKALPRNKLETVIKSKTKKGYREITVVADAQQLPTGPTGPSISKEVIREAAKTQLAKSNSALLSLVDRLVEANKHELYKASGGQMDIDLSTGIISTPVGVVTKQNVHDARSLLDKLSIHVQKRDFEADSFIDSLNSYLMLVPQKVGHSKGWHRNFIVDSSHLQRQNTLLDQLEASADLAESRVKAAVSAAANTPQKKVDSPSLFDAELTLCEDSAVFKMIQKKFMESMNSSHESRRLRPIRVYEVLHRGMMSNYETDGKKLSNQWLLWHGTRMFNVLSILKNGMIIPRSGGSYQITGRMFGDGLYFSDQSTKSLNYSYGYWDRSSRDKNCFMFLADVAMGKYYTPSRPTGHIPAGHDSCYAVGGKSGVMNNEMIVYRTGQANLRYLVEFDEK